MHCDALFARKFDHRLAADAGQHESGPWGKKLAVAHEEDVAPEPFRDVAVVVEEDGPGVRILGAHLAIRNQEIDVVLGLGPRTDRVRRSAPGRRYLHADAVAIERCAGSQGQRRAFDDHRGCGLLLAQEGIGDPRAHPLKQPVVLVRSDEVQVALQHLVGDRHHLVTAETRVDLEIAHGAEQPVDVLLEPERLVPDGARGVEDRFAELESTVAERDEHPALRLDLAVVVRDTFVGELSHEFRLAACILMYRQPSRGAGTPENRIQSVAPLASSCTAKNDARTGCSGSSIVASESRARRVARPRTTMPSFRFGMGLRAMGKASAAL